MQTCKGEQAFSPRMPTLHQREENDLNALGFEPLLKNLLYDYRRYSEEKNKIVFSAVQEFITETSTF